MNPIDRLDRLTDESYDRISIDLYCTMKESNMEDLVFKAQRGDDKAFYELISECRSQLYGTALQYLRNESLALEVVQEVTCRAYLRINKLKDPKYFSTWLIRVMINYCLDEIRKQKQEFKVQILP